MRAGGGAVFHLVCKWNITNFMVSAPNDKF